MTNRLKPSSRVESRGHLPRQAFVLDEAMPASRLYGLLIKAFGVQFSALQARNLGTDQRVLVGESRWINFGPLVQLFLVRRQEFAPPLLFAARRALVACRHRQRGVIEVVE